MSPHGTLYHYLPSTPLFSLFSFSLMFSFFPLFWLSTFKFSESLVSFSVSPLSSSVLFIFLVQPLLRGASIGFFVDAASFSSIFVSVSGFLERPRLRVVHIRE